MQVCSAFCAETGVQPLFVAPKNSAESMVYFERSRHYTRAANSRRGAGRVQIYLEK